MPLHLELVTPERVLFREDVDEVTLPTAEGEITILPNHIQLVAALIAGVARIKRTADTHRGVPLIEMVAVSSGFIEVREGSRVRVLADTAERGHELELSVIEIAKERAARVMQEAVRSDDVSYVAAAALLERELARYKVARKHHRPHHVPTIDAANLPHDENPA